MEGARRVDLNHPRVRRSVHIRSTSPDQMLGLHGAEHLVPGNKFRTAAGTTKVGCTILQVSRETAHQLAICSVHRGPSPWAAPRCYFHSRWSYMFPSFLWISLSAHDQKFIRAHCYSRLFLCFQSYLIFYIYITLLSLPDIPLFSVLFNDIFCYVFNGLLIYSESANRANS